MKRKLLCYLLGISCCYTAALTQQNMFEKENELYQAEEYTRAIKSYQAIETSHANDKQILAIARFNEALAQAAQGDQQQAIVNIRTLLDDKNSFSPIFERVLQRAFLILAIEQVQHLETAEAESLLKEARQSLKRLQVLDCLIQSLKGRALCLSDSYTLAITSELNRAQAQLVQQQKREFFHPNSAEEGLWRLQLMLRAFREHSVRLKDFAQSSSFLQEMSDSYTKEDTALLKLFIHLQSLLDQEQQQILDQLSEAVDRHLSFRAIHQWKATEQALNEADQWLEKLTDRVLGEEKQNKWLLQLLAGFEFALKGEWISRLNVDILLHNFKRFSEEQVFPSILKAKNSTHQASQSLQEGHQLEARLYLETGRRELFRAIFQKQGDQLPPEEFLKQAIMSQRNAVKLSRIGLEAESSLSENALALLSIAQQEVIDLVHEFPLVAYQQQQLDFQGTAEKPGRCQHHPWAKVFNFFYQGLIAAKKAQISQVVDRVNHQEEALKKIKEALEALKAPIDPSQDSCYPKKQPPKKTEENQQQGQAEKKPQESVENVLQQVQLMEQDDRLEKKRSVLRVGEKPW